jgi:hypothetical protein
MKFFTFIAIVGMGMSVSADETGSPVLSLTTEIFSDNWMNEYSSGRETCNDEFGYYRWKGAGLGSNLNNLLYTWVWSISKGWDLSVVVNGGLDTLECSEQSSGRVHNGWSCLFDPIPHACIFGAERDWKDHMIDDYSRLEYEQNLEYTKDVRHIFKFETLGLKVDKRRAKSIMAKYLWSHLTPWIRKHIEFVKYYNDVFQTKPYLGIHVRRGDKLIIEAKYHPIESYMEEAVKYYDSEFTTLGVNDIEAIWIASDDSTVIDEVRSICVNYFPNVRNESISFASNGINGGLKTTTDVRTHTRGAGYAEFVYIMSDIEQLVESDLFVGTMSSNVGRLVEVLRDGMGKPRNSSVSLDWGQS